MLAQLAALTYEQKLSKLVDSDTDGIVNILTATPAQQANIGNTRVFTILNSHGLHARPSAILVHAMKSFKSNLLVANATANSQNIDGRVLSNVTGLGLANGHQIAVTAYGLDVTEALDAIESAIASGLKEAVA